jgi:GNAT superfamily N-acetyltransferase
MDIHIRRGRRTDYAALAALCSWPRDEQRPQRSLRLFRRTVADLAYDLYIADHLGEPVGVVAVSYVRELGLGGQRATLEELLVHPERRGSGIGRQLLEFALRRARRRGARRFEARPADEDAGRFLDHVGFKPSGSRYACELAQDGRDGEAAP